MTSCSTHLVDGSLSTTTETYSGPIDVTVAITDSFDIEPSGTCSGRGTFKGIADGAPVQAHGITHGHFNFGTVTTRYEHDDYTRQKEDDGQYCVMTYSFTPDRSDPTGRYLLAMPLPGGGWGYTTEIKPNSAGIVDITTSTCTELAAPPQKTAANRLQRLAISRTRDRRRYASIL
jgi:hypothetical protein